MREAVEDPFDVRLIDHKGKFYYCGLPTRKMEHAFARAVVMDAVQMASGNQEAVAAVMRDVAAGKYDYHRETVQEALQTFDGMVRMAALMFNIPEDEMLRLVQARTDQVVQAVRQAVLDSTPPEHREAVAQTMRGKRDCDPDASQGV